MLKVNLDGSLHCPCCGQDFVDLEDKLDVDAACPAEECSSDKRVEFMYCGWRITYDRHRPVTGTWRADRHGVGLCNNSKESIEQMVNTKVAEKRDANLPR